MCTILARSPSLHERNAMLYRVKVGGTPLLESKHFNISVPTMHDVAASLPSSWQKDVCHIDRSSEHPSQAWLEQFWSLPSTQDPGVPTCMQFIALVPVAGQRLASAVHCTQHQALRHSDLDNLPQNAANTLCAIGCICITDERADCCSPIPSTSEPITAALDCTSRRLGIPLHQLLSQQRQGRPRFHDLREILADIQPSSNCSRAQAWSKIRQCPVFESTSGSMIALSGSQSWGLLPDAAWEQHIAELDTILSWTPVEYHTASALQRELLKLSNMTVPCHTHFLDKTLFPAIERSQDSRQEPLLLQALDELAARPPLELQNLSSIFVHGRCHKVSRSIDSTSSLLCALFSHNNMHDEYQLLPHQYTTGERLAFLKQHGLAREHTPNAKFFLECAKRFEDLSSQFFKRRQEEALQESCQHAGQQRGSISAVGARFLV